MVTILIKKKVPEYKFLAMTFLECADNVRYKKLWFIIRNNCLTGTYHCLKKLTDSFKLPSHYMPSVTHTTPQDGGKNQRGTNVQFTQVKGTNQQNEEIAGIDINTKDDVTCYNYQQP